MTKANAINKEMPTGNVVGTTDTQTLSNKTLTLPTIGSFTNANHSHQTVAQGGTLDAAAIAAGTLKHERGGLEANVSAFDGFIRISGGSTTELKSEFNKTVNPTATDDSSAGYVVGSRWINTTADKEFVNLDNTATAAVWTETTGAGGGSQNLFETIAADSGTNPVADSPTDTLNIVGGEGIDTVGDATTDTITISGEDASDTNKGIASFLTADFDVTAGAVSLEDTVVKSISGDTGTATPVAHDFTIVGGTRTTTTGSGSNITVDVIAPSETDFSHIFDTTTQAVVTANVFQDITLNTNGQLNGWTHTAGSADITCNQTGIYLVSYNATIEKTGGGGPVVEIIGVFNAIEVAGSQTSDAIAANSAPINVASSFIISATSGQILKFQLTATSTKGQITSAGVNAVTPVSFNSTITRLQ